jgi:hypothetical protein
MISPSGEGPDEAVAGALFARGGVLSARTRVLGGLLLCALVDFPLLVSGDDFEWSVPRGGLWSRGFG